MNIVLDNCVHYKAKNFFSGHAVLHARDLGWQRLKNGELLARAAEQFDLLVTTDKKIRYEQNLDQLPLPILELNSRLTRFEDLKALQPYLEAAILATRKYRFVSLHSDGAIEGLGAAAPSDG